MKLFLGLVLLGLSISIGTANALPIFSHTSDGFLFTITVDGTNEPTYLGAVTIDNIIGSAIFPDTVINYPGIDRLTIVDLNFDDFLQFTFFNTNNLAALTGTVSYRNETREAFTYSLADAVDPTPPGPEPSPSVPEPSTFLLLGAGLIGIGVTRSLKNRA
jgi:hypothetical protein